MSILEKVSWLPVRSRKVLFARTRGQTVFYCVGGKREPGESDEQALIRETREEAGVTLDPKTIQHFHTFRGPSYTGGEMDMICYDAEHFGSITPSSEVEEVAWFTSADMYRTTEMGHMILDWLKKRNLID